MTNISLLLAALLLAALQQQLLVVDGGSYHKEVPRKQHSTQQHQHRHQHFLSDTSKTSQQQQQQHHHQQHHRGDARHQQQRQQQPHNKQSSLWQQEYKLKAAMSTEPTTTITTTKTEMHKKHNLQNHHHHQQQQQQQQGQRQQKDLQQHHQEESIIKRFAVIAAAAGSDVAHFDATHTAVKGQRQPLLLSTSTEASSSTLTEVSKFSSSKDASATSNQLKTSASSAASLSSTSSSSSSLSSSSSPFSSLTKSSSPQLADANRTQHYKSSSDAVVAADDRRLRLKSMESLDYADDYYYDDGDDDEDEETNNNNDDDDDNEVDGDDGHNRQNNDNDSDDVASMENYDSDSDAERRPHISSTRITTNSARVVRDHHHHHHDHHRRQHFEPLDFIASGKTSRLDHQATKPSLPSLSPHYLNEPSQYLDHDQQQLLASDQDYADDEPYRSSAENYLNDAPGVLTDQKFRELGTLEAVQQARDKMLQEQEHMRQKTPAELAREHMDRMKTAGRCSRPLPRVIHVSNETSKRYVPYCTILHRCGEDTGCCDSTRQVCAAKSFEDVPVYFFVIKVNSRSNKRDTEVLMLRNHTECHCVNRSNLSASLQYMPRDKRSDMQRRRYHHSQQYTQRSFYEDSLAVDMSNMICRCPKHFDIFPVEVPYAERHSSDNASSIRCRCDCLSHNVPCRRLQQGEEGFAVDERKCIAERICQAPVCLHGDYSHQTGRCPRRKNHKRTVTRYDYGYG